MTSKDQITQFLVELSAGNHTIVGSLMPMVYDELRNLAHRQLRGERPDHTLNTTALVHEAYLNLVRQDQVTWQNRAHFMSVAALAMRRILINYANQRNAQKRGGGEAVATFDEAFMGWKDAKTEDLLALDECLDHLAKLNERQAKVVELQFFGGLKQEEIAEVLNVSVHTVRRDWRIARAWLSREMARPEK